MGKETVTYVTYSQGIDAKHISLGNLAHDPKNPKFYEPYVEKSYTDIAEPAPEWASSTPLENYALTVGQDSDSPEKYQVVAAAKATKLEIKDPSKFFSTTTLSNDPSKTWLTLRLSANASLPSKQPAPEIWLLTGLIIMQHATWTTISTSSDQSNSFTPGLTAPFDPTGVTNLRRLSVSDNVRPTFGFKDSPDSEKQKHISGAQILETGKYPGSRVWAARWEKVEAVVKDGKEWKDEVGNLKLRLEEGVRKFAAVKLREGEYAVNKKGESEGDGEGLSDKFWEEYLDDIAEEE